MAKVAGSNPFVALSFLSFRKIGMAVSSYTVVLRWLGDILVFASGLVSAMVSTGIVLTALELINLLIRASYRIRYPFGPAARKLGPIVAFPVACGSAATVQALSWCCCKLLAIMLMTSSLHIGRRWMPSAGTPVITALV